MDGGPRAELAGATPMNCARHSDNISSAVRLFTGPKPKEESRRSCVETSRESKRREVQGWHRFAGESIARAKFSGPVPGYEAQP